MLLFPSASTSSLSTADYILSALSGSKDKVDLMSVDELNPPENSVSTEIPVCVMDGTDVETVVVMSEWSEIEFESNHVVEEPREDGGNLSHCSESERKESQSSESFEKGEVGSECEKDFASSMNCCSEESGLNHTENEHASDDMKKIRVVDDLSPGSAESKQFYCHSEPKYSSTLRTTLIVSTGAAQEPESMALPIATRRSTRKSKKTWKIKLVNLQKQKRKNITLKVGNGQKRERGHIVPTRNDKDTIKR